MNEFIDFPLSDLRSALLESLASPHHDIEWASGSARRWLVGRGFAEYNLTSSGYTLTRLGEIAFQLDVEHRGHQGSKALGRSPIKDGGNVRGTTLRCACGWKTGSNEAAKGGARIVRAAHRQHIAKIGAELLAAASADKS